MTEESDFENEIESEVVLEGQLVCALTGEQRTATPQEETLQSFVEQLHREYGISIEQMARDVKISCVSEEAGKQRKRTRTISIAVYAGKGRDNTDNRALGYCYQTGNKERQKINRCTG
jgi:hypothetical protein